MKGGRGRRIEDAELDVSCITVDHSWHGSAQSGAGFAVTATLCSFADMAAVNSLLHDLSGLGPGPEGLPHAPVSIVEASQVHVGVDVLVVVVLLRSIDGLREREMLEKTEQENVCAEQFLLW